MTPHDPRRQPLGITRAAAWIGSTSLALLVGCVDAPEPTTSPAPPDASEVVLAEPALVEPNIAEPTPVVASEPTPTAADGPDPDGWVASPTPVPEPDVTSAEPSAEPTRAEPTPVAETATPRLIPDGLSSTRPTPLPTDAEPTRVADSGRPVPEANSKPVEPKPLEAARPPALILISPRHSAPMPTPSVASPETQQASSQRPAVILPPSTVADAALRSPLKAGPPVANPQANVADAVLAAFVPTVLTLSPPTHPLIQPPSPAGSTGTPVSPVSISQPIAAPPQGFTALFNNQDLTGWEVYDGKSESWQFKDGAVSCVAPGGGWLQSLDLYCDFEMRFEYRLSPGGNSGVCLRFPGHGNPSLEGLEIQLLDDRAEKYHSIQAQQATGSLYFVTAPQVRDVARAAGEWNQCTLRCLGHQLQVTINNQRVNEIDLSQLNMKSDGTAKRPAPVRCPMGSIALQSHSTRVDFRNVHIQDLTQALPSGVRWLDLQAGTGEPVPAGATVTVHYLGFLTTGKRFANSIEKGQPATVPLQDVIPGWREGIPGMKVGGKRRLIVPASMAYGAKGFKQVVPPNSTLVYEIELTAFEVK